jgi:hypothetical protein
MGVCNGMLCPWHYGRGAGYEEKCARARLVGLCVGLEFCLQVKSALCTVENVKGRIQSNNSIISILYNSSNPTAQF